MFYQNEGKVFYQIRFGLRCWNTHTSDVLPIGCLGESRSCTKKRRMSERIYARPVFDRKKEIAKKGFGKVEILVTLSRREKKYYAVCKCTALEWVTYKENPEFVMKVAMLNDVALGIVKLGEPMTIANFEAHLNLMDVKSDKRKKKDALSSPTGFLDFMRACIKKEKNAPKTLSRKEQVIRYLEEFGLIKRFCDVHEYNLVRFNKWLDDGTRETVSIYNYHKVLRKYTRLAYEQDFIPSNPYKSPKCRFPQGKNKVRKPLLEDELLRIRNLDGLMKYEEHARDLFIFLAYTGLSYADSQKFDFETMTELVDDTYHIDGTRVKTGSSFFTPILPPAMEVLAKYDYKVPKLTNQKLNEWLKHIKRYAKINKPLTSHVGRHSFATLCLSYDIPIEDVSRMLGHTKIETTRIYAKILQTTIAKHGNALSRMIK